MSEEIRNHLAALNAAWQRYASAIGQESHPVPIDALNYDLAAAREALAACAISESMLVYDPTTLTFSLPTTDAINSDDFSGTN